MIQRQNHQRDGFNLIEAMVATFMIGIMIGSMFGLHSISMNSIIKLSARLGRVLMLKQELITVHQTFAQQKEYPDTTKKVEDPPTNIQISTKKIAPTSALKSFEHAEIVQLTATWKYRGTDVQESIISFKQKPPPKKEEKAKS